MFHFLKSESLISNDNKTCLLIFTSQQMYWWMSSSFSFNQKKCRKHLGITSWMDTWVSEFLSPSQSFSGAPNMSRCRRGPTWTSWRRSRSPRRSHGGRCWGCGGSRTLRSPSSSWSLGSPLSISVGTMTWECERRTLQVVRIPGGRKRSGRCVLMRRRLPVKLCVYRIGSAMKEERSRSTYNEV